MADGVSTAARTAALFGAMGVAAAAVVGDSIHAGCLERDGPLRAVLAVLAPVAMVIAGGVIGALAGSRRGWRWALVSGLVLLAVGCTVGALAALLCWPAGTWVGLGARDGTAYGAWTLGVVAPVLFLTRRLERVRAGSVAARTRGIVTWCAGGLSMTIGSALAIATTRPWGSFARPPDTTTLHIVAVAGAILSLVSASACVKTSTRGRSLCLAPLQRGAPAGTLAVGPASVDLGLGEGLWTAPHDEVPYRQTLGRQADVIGDPIATLHALHTDDVHAIVCAAGALAVATLTFAMMPPRASAPPSAPLAAAIADRPEVPAPRIPADEEVISRGFDVDARRCFRLWRVVNPEWDGRIAVTLSVAPSGRVVDVSVPSRLNISSTEASCLEFAGKQMRFAPRAETETLEVILPSYIL